MIENQPKADQQKAFQPMAPQAFADWGVGQFAYIKPIVVNGEHIYGVFAANGEQMGIMQSLPVAKAAVVQHGLEPLSAH
jgi:hypothetical protein